MKYDRMPLVALFLVCIIWGTTYLVLRIGVETIPPFLFSGIRMVIGSMCLSLYLLVNKPEFRITQRMLIINCVAGVFFFCLGNGMVGLAERYIPSGLAALICSLPPVWFVLINVFIYKIEKLNAYITLGVLTGLAGMALVFKEHLAELANPAYRLAIVGTVVANLCCVISVLVTKKLNPSPAPILNAVIQLFAGGVSLLVLYLMFENHERIIWTEKNLYALVYLSVVGAAIGYAAFVYALQRLPVTLVSLHTYVNVLVALFLGYYILQEKLNELIVVAVLITICGLYLVSYGLKQNLKEVAALNNV